MQGASFCLLSLVIVLGCTTSVQAKWSSASAQTTPRESLVKKCAYPFWATWETLSGPPNASSQPQWYSDMKAWRTQQAHLHRYNPSATDIAYAQPSLDWTQHAWMAPQMHPFDRKFYNATANTYTVEAWVADVGTRYGKVDAILLWPTYPNIGLDDRNQFDWFMSVPGGLNALSKAITQLDTEFGIKTLLPYNPWDLGTNPRPLPNDASSVAKVLKATSARGINGDTMLTIPETFYTTAKEQEGMLIALEPEVGGSLGTMNYTTMGWGYWSYPETPSDRPCIDIFKWMDQRRMTNVCARWAKTRYPQVQAAFLNADGYVPWENVWGTWNGVTPRDGELIRRVGIMLRFFGGPKMKLLQEGVWEPFVACKLKNTFASLWSQQSVEHNNSTERGVFFLINQNNFSVSGPAVTLPSSVVRARGGDNERITVVDCYHGEVLYSGDKKHLSGEIFVKSIDAHGVGCIFYESSTANKPSSGDDLRTFLNTMEKATKGRPLSNFSDTWEYLQQTRESNHRRPPAGKAKVTNESSISAAQDYGKMVFVHGTSSYNFITEGIEVEGPQDSGVDFQFEWESHPRRVHQRWVEIPRLLVNVYPVTNRKWRLYVEQSGYRPSDWVNYLRFWGPEGAKNNSYPEGADDEPVTWISYDEAADYCGYLGQRLPTPEEWQYIAQAVPPQLDPEDKASSSSFTYAAYPWGTNETKVSNTSDGPLFPPRNNDTVMPRPSNTTAFPAGATGYDIQGLVGLVWHWTSAWHDDHTRAAMLKGGSYYRPSGSKWYFPNSMNVSQHNKYLLMGSSYDRSGAVGFRCVLDFGPQEYNASTSS